MITPAFVEGEHTDVSCGVGSMVASYAVEWSVVRGVADGADADEDI
jgi:hypothetical protein